MRRFRLLADDLTGALDSAARFVPVFGAVPVSWRGETDLPVLGIDSATREGDESAARAAVATYAPALADAALAFKKLDSLLRGHTVAEITACLRAGAFDHAIIAPAFPFQRRITRNGRQLAHEVDVGVDLAAGLRAEGFAVSLCNPGMAASAGISLWDAASDPDLAAIVEAGRALRGTVLWCGSGGLAAALSGGTPPAPPLPRPVLALIGSDHEVARTQLDACVCRVTLRLGDGAVQVKTMLRGGMAAVDVELPADLPRSTAASAIAASFAELLSELERPGTLVVVGGETLRGVCDMLGATSLEVDGEIEPGLPTSHLRGGRWDGLRVVSRSGAFGGPASLARLLGEE
jgi:uncharacterized protein YgbK (DUF1537 family)